MGILQYEYKKLNTFCLLGHNIQILCYDKDLLFLINFMTLIELNGSSYWNIFKKMNTISDDNISNYSGSNLYHLSIPPELVNHINQHIGVYDREILIDSILI